MLYYLRESALLILSDKQQGLNSLRFCSKQIESGGETILSSPMRMLIEHMPGIYVMNRQEYIIVLLLCIYKYINRKSVQHVL